MAAPALEPAEAERKIVTDKVLQAARAYVE